MCPVCGIECSQVDIVVRIPRPQRSSSVFQLNTYRVWDLMEGKDERLHIWPILL